uniref:Uncharacterized protein n=1 Tax=Pipistrellus kuhlii TaxID=59472 RepID=A0A7J8A7Y2_PIPKU|nr:hypothetical protein mPipKuh1_009031 [Pipistrellus kuhlii]
MGYGSMCSHFVDFLGSVNSHSYPLSEKSRGPHRISRILRTPQLTPWTTELEQTSRTAQWGWEQEADSQNHRKRLLLGPSSCCMGAVWWPSRTESPLLSYNLISSNRKPKHQHDRSAGRVGRVVGHWKPGTQAPLPEYSSSLLRRLNTNTVMCNKNEKPSERILWVIPSIICAGERGTCE